MGRKLVLPGVQLTDTSAPKLAKYDPIESPGSMLLIEPGHPLHGWEEGKIYQDGEWVPNILAEYARPILGEENASVPVTTDYTTWASDQGLVERTPKGGLHVIYAQSGPNDGESVRTHYNMGWNPLGVNESAFMRWLHADSLEAYKNSSLYISMWVNITRGWRDGSQATDILHVGSRTSSTGRYRTRFSGYSLVPSVPSHLNSPGAALHGSTTGSRLLMDPPGVRRIAVASRGYNSDLPSSNPSNVSFAPFVIGNYGTVNTYLTAKGASPSAILYRVYVENMDVSGRTYEEINAIDSALYEQAFGPGGRYHGDTFTDPATIP